MTTWLPIFALVISVASITLSIVSFVRDRAKLKAWAEITYSQEGAEGAFTRVTMTVSLVNIGRRPIVLVDFEARSKHHRWKWKIAGVNGYDLTQPLDAEKRELAQNSVVRLNEGDIREATFSTADAPSFIFTHEDPIERAESLVVVGCSGRRYLVRGSKQALRTLLVAWDKMGEKNEHT